MSWQCRLIEYNRDTNSNTLQIGDMFYGPSSEIIEAMNKREIDDNWYWPCFFCREYKLSEYYKQNNKHRPPLLVWLPGRTLFCVDSACWRPGANNKVEYYGGWTVTGEAPLITVAPSINCVGVYHGWLQNGVLSDDCEGRIYDEIGNVRK